MSAPVIRFTNVAAGYGGDPVLTGLNFELGLGDGLCFLGSNGSGKSTVLRAAAKSCDIVAGSVEYLGQNMGTLRRDELAPRGIGYVTQTRGLFADLTVEENIRVAALGAGVEPNDASAELFDRFSLSRHFIKSRAGKLSGGERTVAALIRALATRPNLKLLLLDEVSAGLSAVNESVLVTVLAELRRGGIALLMSEQNVPFAEALSIPARRIARTYPPMTRGASNP